MPSAEVVFRNASLLQSDLSGVDRLLDDTGDELVGGARIVPVSIIAKHEVAEFRAAPPGP